MAVVELNKNNFDHEVLEAQGTVLIDFWAPWCQPCRMLSPVVDEVAEEVPAKVCKINIDNEPGLAQSFGVMSIPTLIVLKSGKVVNRSVGVIPKDKILDLLG